VVSYGKNLQLKFSRYFLYNTLVNKIGDTLTPTILIIDENETIQNELRNLIDSNFQAECEHVFSKEEALQRCKEKAYQLIIIDPMIPSSFDGEEVIKEQRQFYSINKETPMIIFTEDIDYISRLAEEYQIHPESKIGPVSKILNPIKMQLGV
jgi:CheY-like chemotaxis protein